MAALPLRHTFYVDDAGDWRAAAVDEIVRVAAARELGPAEYLELLPADGHRPERLRVRVERAGVAGEHLLAEPHRHSRKSAVG